MTPETELSAETRQTGHRWVDVSVALCALVVSITSLAQPAKACAVTTSPFKDY